MPLFKASTACLEAQYTFPLAYTSLPAIEPTLIIWPFLFSIKILATCLSYTTSLLHWYQSFVPNGLGFHPEWALNQLLNQHY